MPRQVELLVEVAETPEEVARHAAALWVRAVKAAVDARGLARVAVSGGSTPKALFALLADPAESFRAAVPWDRVHLFWVDERCVGPDDSESNYGMTRKAMLDHLPELPATQVHRMEGELDPAEGAARYEAEIRNAFRLEGAETPTFDLILLGMGPDGHTASLFPHTEALDNITDIVVANHVVQKETWRLTLTSPVLNQGREVAFLAEGAGKAAILKQVFTGPYDPETLPSQMIRPASGSLRLLTDKAGVAEIAEALTPAGEPGLSRLELR